MNELEEKNLKYLDYGYSPLLGWIVETYIEPVCNTCYTLRYKFPKNIVVTHNSNELNVRGADQMLLIVRPDLTSTVLLIDHKIVFNEERLHLSQACYKHIYNAKPGAEIHLSILEYQSICKPWNKQHIRLYDKDTILANTIKENDEYYFYYKNCKPINNIYYGWYGNGEYETVNYWIDNLSKLETKFGFIKEAKNYHNVINKKTDKEKHDDLVDFINRVNTGFRQI